MKVTVENENLYHRRNEIERQERQEILRKRRKIRKGGILFILFVLVVASLLNMSSVNIESIYFKGFKEIWKHYLYIGIGIFLFFITKKINYQKYREKWAVSSMLLLSIVSLLFVYIGSKIPALKNIVPTVNGAIGWVRIGVLSIQPSELMKLPFIIILAKLFAKSEEERYKSAGILANVLAILIIYIILVMLQKDLGTVIHYTAIFCVMLFVSKIDFKLIIGTVTTFGAGVLGLLYYVVHIGNPENYGYRYKRVISFLDGLLKNEYDKDIGHQVGQSLMAFGRGGILGEGYANGVQKYRYIPEADTDFVLATFGEEFGFLGMFLLIILFLLLFNNIKRVAMETDDYFGKYLALGIGGYIMTQVLINIYVALGMLPVFGIPMPIFSWGGTSLITIFSALGIVININGE